MHDPIATSMNEPIAAVLLGMLLSLSAGVRLTFPLLALSLLAFYHVVDLPEKFHWLAALSTVILFSVAAGAETLIHFVPAVGTWLKGAETPLAFAAGTLLMSVPLADANPVYRWTLALALGGGGATLTHLGLTGLRTLSGPANLMTAGAFGIVWNLGEIALSLLFTFLGGICLFVGWVLAVALLVLVVLLGVAMVLKYLWIAANFLKPARTPATLTVPAQEEALP